MQSLQAPRRRLKVRRQRNGAHQSAAPPPAPDVDVVGTQCRICWQEAGGCDSKRCLSTLVAGCTGQLHGRGSAGPRGHFAALPSPQMRTPEASCWHPAAALAARATCTSAAWRNGWAWLRSARACTRRGTATSAARGTACPARCGCGSRPCSCCGARPPRCWPRPRAGRRRATRGWGWPLPPPAPSAAPFTSA
jgi:hypothetical protein